jgi:hypothetical protein
MAQLSRPYQIALGAVVVLGLVWAVALRTHGSNPSEPAPASSSASTSAKTASTASTAVKAASTAGATAGTKGVAAPTPIYHGAAPGVEGLTRAIAKAHGAVAISQQNADQLERKSSEAAEESQSSPSTPTSVAGTAGSTATQNSIVATTIARRTAARARARAASKSHSGRSAQQRAVEAELVHGKTVMLVFWNPRSTVDQEVMAQVDTLAGGSKGAVVVHAAFANQVGLFGTITEVAHVYETPTILIVNRRGLVSTLTGLTDVFSLQQVVREAQQAGR